jgi:ABC-type lipoprotein export system ATPase subunit
VGEARIVERHLSGEQSVLRLDDGSSISARRFFPAGKGDLLRITNLTIEAFAKHDGEWVTLTPCWSWKTTAQLGPYLIDLTFKEIETTEELSRFEGLRRFHYRGSGGAGRAVPIIATTEIWDLPRVAGFIELSSSMIANTARKRFFDHPYFENAGVSWREWDSSASKRLSNTISRISRFVIHPELRGLGLAQAFLEAAKRYSAERWHFGGRKPRFIEITADMLRYYRFLGPDFAYMGETEGNEHRLVKDMTYLVRKALAEGEGMPQGGGGIMTLQRGYASRLLKYLGQTDRGLREVVRSLQHNPALLDQETWEALHRLNRKPKLSFVSGLTPKAQEYVELRKTRLQPVAPSGAKKALLEERWEIRDIHLRARTEISQSSEARVLQDAFGFVGSGLTTELIDGLSFDLKAGEVTLICGASGSGKSLLLEACARLLADPNGAAAENRLNSLELAGTVNRGAKIQALPPLPDDKVPLELRGRASVDEFLQTAAKCGLAEPQLLVRPTRSLSSGQRYRLRVALAFLTHPDVVIIDNFCESLDRYTAISVARGIRRLAAEGQVAVLGATAAYDRDYLVNGVDQSVMLRRGDRAVIQRGGVGSDLQEGLHDKPLPSQEPE